MQRNEEIVPFLAALWPLKMKQWMNNAYLAELEQLTCNKNEQGTLSC